MTPSYPTLLVISNYSGAPNPIRPEAEIIIGLARLGYKVIVMTPRGSDYVSKLEEAGCIIVNHRPPSKLHIPTIGLIQTLVKEYKVSIVQAFHSRAISNAALALLFNRKVKLVSYRGYTGNIHWYDPSLYFTFLNPRINKMICLAESVREQYIKNGVSPDRAVTINKGHDASWYDHIQAANLDEFQIPSGAMICSFVANHRLKMKGVRYLIEAIGELPQNVRIHALMLGDGLLTSETKSWLKANQVEDKFTFTGFRSDASSIVKACDLSISLSLFGEATQKAMIEAMYLGNPVIMTDISGNRGMVINGEGGKVVPPGNALAVRNALEELYNQRSQLPEMGKQAKQHIAEFLSVERSIKEYDAFYRTIAP